MTEVYVEGAIWRRQDQLDEMDEEKGESTVSDVYLSVPEGIYRIDKSLNLAELLPTSAENANENGSGVVNLSPYYAARAPYGMVLFSVVSVKYRETNRKNNKFTTQNDVSASMSGADIQGLRIGMFISFDLSSGV